MSPVVEPALPTAIITYVSAGLPADRKSTRLNSSHLVISCAVFCLKKKKKNIQRSSMPTDKKLYTYSPSIFFFHILLLLYYFFFFFFNDTATTEIYTLSLHDALPIFPVK